MAIMEATIAALTQELTVHTTTQHTKGQAVVNITVQNIIKPIKMVNAIIKRHVVFYCQETGKEEPGV